MMITVDITGVTDANAAWIYTVFSLVMGCSGLVVGGISDKVLGPAKVIAITSIAAALVSGIFIFTNVTSMTMYIIFVSVVGIAIASVSTLIAVILMNAYGSKNFGINFGLIQCGPLIGSFIGPQLAVRESMTFLTVGAIAMLVCGVLFLLAGTVLNKEIGKKVF